jgi:transposase
MPAKNHLSQEPKEKLLRAMRENESPQIRERCLILLLINEEKTYQKIANFLGISYPTVADWGVHGDPDKMESFADGRSQGNFRKATPKYEELLLEVVKKEPLEYGYEFGRWTGNRLATYLDQVTGIK